MPDRNYARVLYRASLGSPAFGPSNYGAVHGEATAHRRPPAHRHIRSREEIHFDFERGGVMRQIALFVALGIAGIYLAGFAGSHFTEWWSFPTFIVGILSMIAGFSGAVVRGIKKFKKVRA